MSWTKRQLVEDAYAEIGLASYAFDLQPGMIMRAVRKMDGLLAQWNSKGIRIGYPLSSDPDPDDECDIPDVAYNAIITNLGMAIAPGHGKVVTPGSRIDAKRAYDALLAFTIETIEVSLNTLPSGAGNKPGRIYEEFMPESRDNITTGKDNILDI